MRMEESDHRRKKERRREAITDKEKENGISCERQCNVRLSVIIPS